MTFKTVNTSVAALLLLALVTPASAEETAVTIDYSDLDLSSASGLLVLKARIRGGVSMACEKPSIREIAASAAWQSCLKRANAQALAQLTRALGVDRRIALAGDSQDH
jgi:UrcA family protein